MLWAHRGENSQSLWAGVGCWEGQVRLVSTPWLKTQELNAAALAGQARVCLLYWDSPPGPGRPDFLAKQPVYQLRPWRLWFPEVPVGVGGRLAPRPGTQQSVLLQEKHSAIMWEQWPDPCNNRPHFTSGERMAFTQTERNETPHKCLSAFTPIIGL